MQPPIKGLGQEEIVAWASAQLVPLRAELFDAFLSRRINPKAVDEILAKIHDVYAKVSLFSRIAGTMTPWAPKLLDAPGRVPALTDRRLSLHTLTTWDILTGAVSWLGKQISGFPGMLAGMVDASQVEAAAYGVDVDTAMMQRLNKELAESIKRGEGRDEWRARLKGIMETRAGFDETIARTAMHRSFHEGKNEVLEQPIIRDVFPYRKYYATGDSRTRPHHLEMDGKIYHKDSPLFRQAQAILSEWNCILPGQSVEGEFLAATRSYYNGDAVEIITLFGRKIRVTKNHPVLTENGWVPAGSLKQGDKLVRHMREAEIGSGSLASLGLGVGSAEINHQPTAIEKVFCSLSAIGFSERRRCKAGDFHGDGHSIHSYIDVVWSDFKLLSNGESAAADHLRNVVFESPLDCPVSGHDLGGALRVIHGSPFNTLCVGLTSKLDACLLNPFGDERAGNSSSLRKLIDGCSILVVSKDRIDIKKIETIPRLESESLQPCGDGLLIASELIGNFVSRHAGLVSFDEVASCRPIKFSGHVYDLQSVTGFIVADSIILANCRCSEVPLTEEDALAEGVSSGGEGPRGSASAAANRLEYASELVSVSVQ